MPDSARTAAFRLPAGALAAAGIGLLAVVALLLWLDDQAPPPAQAVAPTGLSAVRDLQAAPRRLEGRNRTTSRLALAGPETEASAAGPAAATPPRQLDVLVVDAQRAAVPGARLRLLTAGSTLGTTDAAGRSPLVLPPRERWFRVVADGYRNQDVPVGEGDAGEVVVVLEAGNGLAVTLRLTRGFSPARLSVAVAATEDVYLPGEALRDTSVLARRTGWQSSGRGVLRATAGGIERVSWCGDDGRVRLTGLRSDLDLRVVVRDRHERVLHETAPFAVGPTEWKELDLDLDVVLSDLTVTVRDEVGDGVRGAWLWTPSRDGSWNPRVETDADGVAVLGELTGDRVTLRVSADGYVPRELIDVDVARGQREVVLRSGRVVDVALVDTLHESHLLAEWVRADWTEDDRPMNQWWSKPVYDDGGRPVYRLTGLPEGTVTIEASVGGHAYRAEHDTTRGELALELPCLGSLRARWHVPVGSGGEVVLTAVGEDGALVDGSSRSWPTNRPGYRTLEGIEPGPYRVVLRRRDPAGGAGEEITRPLVVAVRAHELEIVDLPAR